MPFGAGGLEAGQAYVDLVPRLSPNFASQTSSALTAGLRPGTAALGTELEQAGAAAGTRTGTAAATGIGSSLRTGLGGIAASVGGLFAGIGAVRLISGAVDEAREAIKVGQQTDAVIKSTGGSAGITAKHIGDLANKLSLVAGVDDELIQQGENVLLTFTSIRNETGKGNDVFDRATTAALDMSKALKTDLQGSLIQVGKALQDPVAGLTALKRVGVNTGALKKPVEDLVKAGDTLGAQKLILGELESEFGGTAAAVADPLDKASVAAKNLQEVLGLALMPVLTDVANIFAKDIAPVLTSIIKIFESLPGPVRTGIVAIIGIGVAASAFGSIIGGLGFLFNPWLLAIAAVIVIGVLLVKNWDAIKEKLGAIWQQMKDGAVVIWTTIRDFFVNLWADIERIFNDALAAIGNFITNAFNAVRDFFIQWWPFILGIFTGGLGLVVGLIIQHWSAIKDFTVNTFNDIVNFFASIPGRIVGALGDVGGLLLDAGKAIINSLLNGITSAADAIIGTVKGIGKRIAGALNPFGSPQTVAFYRGQDAMDDFVAGAASRAAAATMSLKGITPSISSTVSANLTGVAGRVGPAVAAGGAGVIVNGPLLSVSGITIRSDEDIVSLARALDREANRSLRAAGQPVGVLP
jgi:hypothetical protein